MRRREAQSRIPWVVRIYIWLLAVSAGLLAVTSMVPGGERMDHLFGLASSALHMVLGALLGALSWAAEAHFRDKR
jgi:hypothetical protein